MSEDLERIRASIEQIEHKISRIEDRVYYPLGCFAMIVDNTVQQLP